MSSVVSKCADTGLDTILVCFVYGVNLFTNVHNISQTLSTFNVSIARALPRGET